MKLEFSTNPIEKISADVILVFALQHTDQKKTGFIPLQNFKDVDSITRGKLSEICRMEQFTGKKKETVTYYPEAKTVLANKIIVVGLGKREDFIADDLRRSMGSLAKKLHYSVDSVLLSFNEDDETGL